jgi:hypothetical protein
LGSSRVPRRKPDFLNPLILGKFPSQGMLPASPTYNQNAAPLFHEAISFRNLPDLQKQRFYPWRDILRRGVKE